MMPNTCKTISLLWILVLLACFAAWAEEPLVKVDVTGLEGAPLENAQAALALPAGIIRNEVVEERWLERFVGKIPQRVAEALEPFGYYRSQTEVSIDRSRAPFLKIQVTVKAGPATRVRKLTLRITGEGSQEEGLLKMVREFPLKKGEPLDHQLYERGKL